MDQRWLRNFMPAAVGRAEDELNKPLQASFAGNANSGLSFGAMQNDIRTNPEAARTFKGILDNAQIDPDRVVEIMAAGTRKGIKGDQFEQEAPGGTARVNAALAQNPGMVADQDASSTSWLRTKVANALGGAATNPNGPGQLGDNPKGTFVADVAGWLNRTGDKEAYDVRDFLHKTPDVTETAFKDYLRDRPYFAEKRGETVDQWTGRLARPGGAADVGQKAYDDAPASPEPGNLFNTKSFEADVAGRNLLNSETFSQNLLNSAEENLHKAGY